QTKNRHPTANLLLRPNPTRKPSPLRRRDTPVTGTTGHGIRRGRKILLRLRLRNRSLPRCRGSSAGSKPVRSVSDHSSGAEILSITAGYEALLRSLQEGVPTPFPDW